MVKGKTDKHQRKMGWVILWRELTLSFNHGGVQVTKLKCPTIRELKLDKMDQPLNTYIVTKKHVSKHFITAFMGTLSS